jgi:heptosyltransferase III
MHGVSRVKVLMIEQYPDLSHVRKILVAKLRHHGDVLLSSPIFSLLKKRFPQAQIDAYLYKETLPMLEGMEEISAYLLYDKSVKKRSLLSRGYHEAKLLLKVWKSQYDLVINLTEGDRGALVAAVSNAKVRIGFDPEGRGMFKKENCYTHIAKICHHTRHTVERNLDVLRCLGIFPTLEERELSFVIPQAAYDRVEALLKEEGITRGQFVMIHPVSRWLFKCLPEKTIAQIVCHLHSRGEKVVLTASSDPLEMEMNQKIMELASGCSVMHLGGKISLKELGALIEYSKLLICVDSVPLHMASALKAPVLAFFGPTSEKTWAPWRNPYARIVTAHDYPCRPCYMPGCGGSKRSDCLEAVNPRRICSEIDDMLANDGSPLDKLYTLKSSPK